MIEDFKSLIGQADKANKIQHPGFFVWGNCVIRHTDGLYYSFINKWDSVDGFHGWVHYNRIYVSDGRADKFDFANATYRELTELRSQSWASNMVTNQKVLKIGNTYYLFYVGTNYSTISYPPIDSEARANQQIGIASFTDPNGTYTPLPNNPILSPRVDKWDKSFVNNPSPYIDINDVLKMAYKSDYFDNKGQLRMGQATGCSIDDWCDRANEPNFGMDGLAEDPDVFKVGNEYYAIAKAFDNTVTQFGNGLFFTSNNGGVSFDLSINQPAWDRVINWTDGTTENMQKEERPFVLVEDGVPTAYYAAFLNDNGESFNVGRPLNLPQSTGMDVTPVKNNYTESNDTTYSGEIVQSGELNLTINPSQANTGAFYVLELTSDGSDVVLDTNFTNCNLPTNNGRLATVNGQKYLFVVAYRNTGASLIVNEVYDI